MRPMTPRPTPRLTPTLAPMTAPRVALATALLVATTGCAAAGSDAGAGGADTTLTVFAAASLTEGFTELGRDFEEDHSGVQVRFSFGGSSDLVAQIENGAPADVVATADEATMAQLHADDLLKTDPRPFVTNTLEIAVPPGNPAAVRTFADLADPDVDLVVCAPQVPCGAAAQAVAKEAHVQLHPVSEEQSVTDVLGKVETGEADAGLVYATDVRAAGDAVKGIPFPESPSVVNRYPIAVVADSSQPGLAQRFIDLTLSAQGRRVFQAAGFGSP